MQWEVKASKTLIEEIGSRVEGSKRELKRLLECNQACVNGKIVHHHGAPVTEGDLIHWQDEPLVLPAVKFTFDPRSVLYEDEHLLAYDKPAGVTSYDVESGITGARLVHRLDRMTSGVLLLAKTGLERWVRAFRRREVKKVYRALVDGLVDRESGRFRSYIRKVAERRWDECGPNQGDEAITDWRVLGYGERCTLMELRPVTGRTHQLRVQLMRSGHAVLGDGHYCRSYHCKYRPARYLLHAQEIEVEGIRVRSKAPRDFGEALRTLGVQR